MKIVVFFFIFVSFVSIWLLCVTFVFPLEGRVRKEILEKTPIGIKFEEVLRFCKDQNLNCSSSKNTGYFDRNDKKEVGIQSIWVVLEKKVTSPVTVRWIGAYWGFDENGELIDVMIRRTVDSL